MVSLRCITWILIPLILLGCKRPLESEGAVFADALTRQASKGTGALVVFGELTPFEWDHVYVVGPYQRLNYVNEHLGTRLPDLESGFADEGESIYVFSLHGSAVAIARHQRKHVSCVELVAADATAFDPLSAKFTVEMPRPGAHLSLRPLSSNKLLD